MLAREWVAARAGQWAEPMTVGGPGTTHRRARLDRSEAQPRWGGRAVSVGLAVVAVIVAVGAVVTDYRIGDSGARAAWTGQFSQQAQPPPFGRTPPG